MDNSWAAPGVLCELKDNAGPFFTHLGITPTGEENYGPDWDGPYKVVRVIDACGFVMIGLYGDMIDRFWHADEFKPITTVKSDAEKFEHLLNTDPAQNQEFLESSIGDHLTDLNSQWVLS